MRTQLDEMSALSAPWFLDRGYAGRYSQALFNNNAAHWLRLSGTIRKYSRSLPSFPC